MATKLGAIKGHKQSVLCCEILPEQQCLVTGGEDGAVCLHDLRTDWSAVTARLQVSEDEAVPSVLVDSARPAWSQACAGHKVMELDLRMGDASCCVHQQACTNAEINALAAAPEGKLLAAADDDGHVTMIDTSKEQYDCQRLNGAHENISSSVVFRQHKPKEAVSGGLDCKLLHWDTSSKSLISSRSSGSEGNAEPRITNPPMIHNLAVAPTTGCPAAQLVAAACGDGTVVVWDLDKGLATTNKRTRARQRQPDFVLGKGDVGHRAAATSVRFIDDTAQRLVSGGNDRQLLLWQTNSPADSASSSHDESCIQPVVKWQHKRKVHAIAWHADCVYVADTSRHVSVYHLA